MEIDQLASATNEAAQDSKGIQFSGDQDSGKDFLSFLTTVSENGVDGIGHEIKSSVTGLSGDPIDSPAEESVDNVIWEAGMAGNMLAGLLFGEGNRMEVDLSMAQGLETPGVLKDGEESGEELAKIFIDLQAGMGSGKNGNQQIDLQALGDKFFGLNLDLELNQKEDLTSEAQALPKDDSNVMEEMSFQDIGVKILENVLASDHESKRGDPKLPDMDNKGVEGLKKIFEGNMPFLKLDPGDTFSNPGKDEDSKGSPADNPELPLSMARETGREQGAEYVQKTSHVIDLHMDSKIAEHIEKIVSAQIEHGGGRVHVRLSPPNLGEMHIEVRVNKEHVGIRFDVNNSNAQALLMKDISQLQNLLKDQGYYLDNVDVYLLGDQGGQSEEGRKWGGKGGSGQHGVEGEIENGPEEVTKANKLDIEV